MRSRRLIAEFKIMDVGCQERGVNLCEAGFEVGSLGRGGISEAAYLGDWVPRLRDTLTRGLLTQRPQRSERGDYS